MFRFQPEFQSPMYLNSPNRGQVISPAVETSVTVHCPFPSFLALGRMLLVPILERLVMLDCTPRTNLCHFRVQLRGRNRLSRILTLGSIVPHNRIMRELPRYRVNKSSRTLLCRRTFFGGTIEIADLGAIDICWALESLSPFMLRLSA